MGKLQDTLDAVRDAGADVAFAGHSVGELAARNKQCAREKQADAHEGGLAGRRDAGVTLPVDQLLRRQLRRATFLKRQRVAPNGFFVVTPNAVLGVTT